jgi:FHA domain/Double zinc ribbon
MIVCPNCKHDNPEGATNCEACYTALPATKACPNCGASIQLEATFCGQCGHNLKSVEQKSPILLPPPATASIDIPHEVPSGLPPTVLTNPAANIAVAASIPVIAPVITPEVAQTAPAVVEPTVPPIAQAVNLAAVPLPPIEPIPVELPVAVVEPTPVEPIPAAIVEPPVVEPISAPVATQLQTSARQLLHLQTNTLIELPAHVPLIHLGKPNDRIPPEIDVSNFPCAEVVSRVHANIRAEGENYYIEDIGSANGTYINHNILAKGNRHLLRAGDRIGLGKGDLVTFIFQSST